MSQYTTWAQMLARIKKKTRQESSTELDSLFLDWANASFAELAEKNRYPELRVWDYEFAIIANPDLNFIPLPSDLLALDKETIYYNNLSEHGTRRLFSLPDSLQSSSYADQVGPPFRFRRAGAFLHLFPNDAIEIGHKVSFSYWKYPEVMEDEDSDIPLPNLADIVIEEVIAKSEKYHNSDAYKVRKQAANMRYVASRGKQDG